MSQRKKAKPPVVVSKTGLSKKQPATQLSFNYAGLLGQVKDRIRHAQVRAMLSVNSELIRLYWDIGRILNERQTAAKKIPNKK